MHRTILAFLIISVHLDLAGQTLEGRVLNQIGNSPVYGANIHIPFLDETAVTDSAGLFSFDTLPSGTYELLISSIGFETQKQSMWLKAGKVTYLDVKLKESILQLDELVVTPINQPKVSSIGITEEKINRYAATYNDPARLASISSDATIANDQNNAISARGLPPELNIWRVEGLEVINPNHLTNAGTFNDQPAASSGGVNIVSAQVIDHSIFEYGYMGSTYTNAPAGVFDLNLRKGYASEHQYTAQASFIGFDLSAEGPLTKRKKSSYLVNYRYSFTGLLASMGVDFGGEKIGFQDLTATINLPLKTNGNIKIFTFGGSSYNHFDVRDPDESKTEKDRKDIYYDGKAGAVGFSFDQPLGNHFLGTVASALSAGENERNETRYANNINVAQNNRGAYSQLDQDIWTSRLSLTYFTRRHEIELGEIISYYNTTSELNSNSFDAKRNQISSYLNWKNQITKTLKLETGLSHNYYGGKAKGDWIDYRTKLSWVKANTSASIAAGRYGQAVDLGVEQSQMGNGWMATLQPVGYHRSSSKYSIDLQHQFTPFTGAIEAFSYRLKQGAIDRLDPSLTSEGISLRISNDYPLLYYSAHASWFKASYENGVINPYDIGQSYSAMIGKKWTYRNGKKALSMNGRFIYQGGMYQAESANNRNLKSRLDEYIRADLRIQWIKYKPNSTVSWTLDVQNMTNRQNEAYQYFDNFTSQLETQYQLGLIPILAYRVEF